MLTSSAHCHPAKFRSVQEHCSSFFLCKAAIVKQGYLEDTPLREEARHSSSLNFPSSWRQSDPAAPLQVTP